MREKRSKRFALRLNHIEHEALKSLAKFEGLSGSIAVCRLIQRAMRELDSTAFARRR